MVKQIAAQIHAAAANIHATATVATPGMVKRQGRAKLGPSRFRSRDSPSGSNLSNGAAAVGDNVLQKGGKLALHAGDAVTVENGRIIHPAALRAIF